MPNALVHESSPYLRQHADNPVDWLPWGPEAFDRARERGVPVLVSIGYSSCHWCHVMERESFEDERTAQVMNEELVCVKVDREERPDVDALYMEAVQGMTGHGGWPLNVFLTPEGVPFYGGTYFPPQERAGMAAFTQVLQAVAEAWRARGQEIAAAADRLREQLSGAARLEPSSKPIDPASLDQAVATLESSYDPLHGGFGDAPKFPQASTIEFLLCRAAAPPRSGAAGAPAAATARPAKQDGSEPALPAGTAASANGLEPAARMALYTLGSMASGAIHDQIGGGFHRYSVDANWTVPHFEKMLYDNALLARAYLHGFQLSGDARLEEVCRDTLDWALREMRGPEGGFFSALDADTEGVEGRFYVWTVAELHEALVHDALGHDAGEAIRWLGATERGNFQDPHHPQPGLNVLEDRGPRPDAASRARIRRRLLQVREQRVRPGLDDKRLTSWNALMIAALAEAGAGLNETRYVETAAGCADFLLTRLRDQDGRLLRTYNDGQAKILAYLEDHAFLVEGLVALFEATCQERWLTEAAELADTMIERFGDPRRGGFFSTAHDGERLIARRKELEDNPIPAGGSSAANGLLRLSQLTGSERYARESARAVALLHEIAPRHPSAFGHLLQAIHWHLSPMRPIACELPSR